MLLCVNTLESLDEFEICFRLLNIGSVVPHRGGRISLCTKHVCPRLLYLFYAVFPLPTQKYLDTISWESICSPAVLGQTRGLLSYFQSLASLGSFWLRQEFLILVTWELPAASCGILLHSAFCLLETYLTWSKMLFKVQKNWRGRPTVSAIWLHVCSDGLLNLQRALN